MDGGIANIGIPWESFARYFARGGLESNFSAICSSPAFGRFDLRRECRYCGGIGERILPFDRVTYWAERIADETRDEEREHLRRQLEKEAFCRACGGVGHVSQRPRGQAVRMDGTATTVACPRCRGKCRSRHGGVLMGSSCGETFPPTDASAEVGDRCPTCLGDAFVVPITVRPTKRTADTGLSDEASEPAAYEPEPDEDDSGVARVVEALRRESDELALGLQVLSGEHGERWAAHDWGRSFSLWPMTDAGERLADEAIGPTLEREPFARKLDLIRIEREAHNGGQARPRRQALIFQADSRARRIEQRVKEAIWRATAA